MHKCKFRLLSTIFSNRVFFISIWAIVGPIVVKSMPLTADPSNNNATFLAVVRDFLLQGDSKTIGRSANELLKNVPTLQLVVSRGLHECLWRDGLLRCLKLYFLQKMEQNKSTPRSNAQQHITFKESNQKNNLSHNEYLQLSDEELNSRLMKNIRSFFSNQTVQMHLLPHMLLRIVPSKENKLQFSLTNEGDNNEGRSSNDIEVDEDKFENELAPGTTPIAALKKTGNSGGGASDSGGILRKQKNKKSSYKHTILQMAVPVMVMPAILMGSLLPFVLPVLKMATIMTILMNNSAFLAALLYAARTHANVQDEQHISYKHSAYHYTRTNCGTTLQTSQMKLVN